MNCSTTSQIGVAGLKSTWNGDVVVRAHAGGPHIRSDLVVQMPFTRTK
jgi:hypothetical protein